MKRRRYETSPLVVHVIPTPLGRGAQREARALVDRLDGATGARHLLLALYNGPDDVAVDLSLGIDGRGRPAAGFAARPAWHLRSAMRKLAPAVVVAHGGDALKFLIPASAGTGRPLVYYDIGTYAGTGSPVQLWLWKQLTRRPDLVVAEGDEVLEECIERFGVDPGRAMMIPNGRDPAEFHPGVPGSRSTTQVTLIFVGALTEQKRPGHFIDVVAGLRHEGRAVRAQLVGGGPLAGPLADRAQTVGVEILGPRSDVSILLRDADVLVFPSRPGGEGMPGVLIEAGLSGLPVVTTPVPGASSVVVHDRTGLIVDHSVDAMTTAVRHLVDDPGLRAVMGAAARERCMTLFSLDTIAEQWRTVLQPLVEAQR